MPPSPKALRSSYRGGSSDWRAALAPPSARVCVGRARVLRGGAFPARCSGDAWLPFTGSLDGVQPLRFVLFLKRIFREVLRVRAMRTAHEAAKGEAPARSLRSCSGRPACVTQQTSRRVLRVCFWKRYAPLVF
jgi:hypothetical protein